MTVATFLLAAFHLDGRLKSALDFACSILGTATPQYEMSRLDDV